MRSSTAPVIWSHPMRSARRSNVMGRTLSGAPGSSSSVHRITHRVVALRVLLFDAHHLMGRWGLSLDAPLRYKHWWACL